MKTQMKRLVSLLMVFALIFGMIPALRVSAGIYGTNYSGFTTKVGNVSLPLPEYPNGSACTTTGSACSSAHYNCRRYYSYNGQTVDVYGWQCCGFARYVFWRCFGVVDFPETANGNGYYHAVSGIGGGSCSVSYLKSIFGSKIKPGAHIRTNVGQDGFNHSLAFAGCDDNYIYTYEGNFDGYCRVSMVARTWSEMSSYLSYKNGIQYIDMPTNYPATAEYKTIPDGVYTIAPVGDTALRIGSNGTSSGSNVEVQTNTNALTQKWVFESQGSGYYSVRNVASNLMLDLSGANTANSTNIALWTNNNNNAQRWQLRDAGDGNFYLYSKCGEVVMDVNGGNAANGTNIAIYQPNKTNAQKFKLTPTDSLVDGIYKVACSANTNYGLNVAGDSTNAGANVQLWTNKHDVIIQHDSAGYYYLRFRHSGMAVDVDGNKSADGTNVLQYTFNTSDNATKFLVIPNTDGTYSFVAASSGKYLDVYNGSMANGTNVQIWSAAHNADQKWVLEPVKTLNDGVYQLGAFNDKTFVLDVQGHDDADGAQMQVLKNAHADGQLFAIEYRGNGYYTLRDTNGNRYVDVAGGGRVNDTKIGMWGKEGEDINNNKLWSAIPNADGSYSFASKASNQYMDLNGGGTTDGNIVHTWQSEFSGKTQKWWVMPTTLNGLEGTCVLASPADENSVLGIPSTEKGAEVVMQKADGSDAQRFNLIPEASTGYYTIKNEETGLNLNVNNNGMVNDTRILIWSDTATAGGDNERWSIVPHADGSYSFIPKINGLYLDRDNNKTEPGTIVHLWTNTAGGGASQRWNLLRHSHSYTSVVTAVTCEADGFTTKTCSECGFTTKTDVVKALGHNFVLDHKEAANCVSNECTVYVCSRCGQEKREYPADQWSDWNTEEPVGFGPDEVMTRTMYRYADKQTTTNNSASMDGWTKISESWKQTGTGKVEYATNWPSGFDKNNSYYTKYNVAAPKASESAGAKRTVGSQSTIGYIYWHWCQNTYTAGPINRYVEDYKHDAYTTLHAFYSTTNPSTLTSADGYYQYSNGSCCKDTYWYRALPVYSMSYTDFTKEYTHERWGAWSEWSETAVTASATRKVETRTEYRVVARPVLGEHTWNNGVVTTAATCVSVGEKLFTCTVCGATKTEEIPALGAHVWNGGEWKPAPGCLTSGMLVYTCTVCSQTRSEEYEPIGHNYVNGVCQNCGDVTNPTDADLKFVAAAVDLEDKIVYSALVSNTVVSGYDRVFVEFVNLDPGDDRMSTYGVSMGQSYNSKYKIFKFEIFLPQLTDRISATLFGVKNGQVYQGQTTVLTAEEFILSVMPAFNKNMQTMCANLLEFGASLQNYFGYHTDHLANDELGTYASLVSHSAPTVSGSYTATSTGRSTVTLRQRVLGIGAVTQLQYAFKLGTVKPADIYVEFVINGRTIRMNGEELVAAGSSYVAVFEGLLPTEANADIRITVRYKSNDQAVSETYTDRLTYALVSYQNSTDANLRNLANAMLNYYLASEAAFGK